jgi:hypothetical protein
MATIEFNEKLNFKAPDGFSCAVAAAAALEHCSMSEFIRQSVFRRLREVGVSLSQSSPRTAAAASAGPAVAAAERRAIA